MAQAIKNVVVVGATGSLGPAVVQGLVEDGRYNVTVLSRQESSKTSPIPNVKVIKTDYSESSLAEALKGQDAVVSTVAGAALATQTTIIDAAVKAGVKRFLPSEFGSDCSNKKAQEICPLFVTKDDVVTHLKKKAAENPNFTWTAVLTGPFFDWCLRIGFTGIDVKSRTATLWDGGDAKWSATNLATVGTAVARILAHPEETKNRPVYVQGLRVSQKDMLAAFEKSTGQKFEVKHVDSDEQAQQGREMLAKGDHMGIPKLILAAILNRKHDCGADFTKLGRLDNELLGLPQEDLQATVDAILSEA